MLFYASQLPSAVFLSPSNIVVITGLRSTCLGTIEVECKSEFASHIPYREDPGRDLDWQRAPQLFERMPGFERIILSCCAMTKYSLTALKLQWLSSSLLL